MLQTPMNTGKRPSIAIICFIPDYGHLQPLLKIADALRERGFQIKCYIAGECRPLMQRFCFEFFALEDTVKLKKGMSRLFGRSIFFNNVCLYAHYLLMYPRVAAAAGGSASRFSKELFKQQPDLIICDALWFGDLYARIARSLGARLILNSFDGSLAYNQRPFVQTYGLTKTPAALQAAQEAVSWISRKLCATTYRLRYLTDWLELRAVRRKTTAAFEAAFPLCGQPPIEPRWLVVGTAVLERRRLSTLLRLQGADRREFSALKFRSSVDVPDELWNWINSSDRPVVYVSFGSAVDIDAKFARAVYNGLRSVPARVIWSLPSNHRLLLADLPAVGDIRFETFVPQPEILGIPAVKCFVTQGGPHSVQEALFGATPMLCIPFFVDQAYNSSVVERLGVGRRLRRQDVSEQTVASAINEILANANFRNNAAILCRDLGRDEGGAAIAQYFADLVHQPFSARRETGGSASQDQPQNAFGAAPQLRPGNNRAGTSGGNVRLACLSAICALFVLVSIASQAAVDDGNANAPPGLPPFAGLLNDYAVRPEWSVAGVDYNVGPRSDIALKNPAAIVMEGVSIDRSRSILTVNRAGITLDGYDFSPDGGWQVKIVGGANNVTIRNCSFKVGIRNQIPIEADHAGYIVVTNSTFDGGVPGGSLVHSMIYAGAGATIEHNRFTHFPDDAIDITHDGNYTIQFNLFDNMGVGDFHIDGIQTYFSDIARITVQYNTMYQPIDWHGPAEVNSFFRIGDERGHVVRNAVAAYNTIVVAGKSSAVFQFTANDGVPASTLLSPMIHDNYINPRGVLYSIIATDLHTGGVVNPITFNNIDMTTGKPLLSGQYESRWAGVPAHPPAAPIITGISAMESKNEVMLAGTAAPGTIISIFDWSVLLGAIKAEPNGSWSFTTPRLDDGDHRIAARATDGFGNTGPLSQVASPR